jgi:hypothetical protein
MSWRKVILIVLVVEKIIQHLFVTWAFVADWAGIRATVAVSPDALMVGGALIALLFAVALWAIWTRRQWAIDLVVLLALVDIVGEFVAQGRIAIQLNVSFVVAVVLLVLGLAYRRAWRTVTHRSSLPVA